jgi:hypothetical protein
MRNGRITRAVDGDIWKVSDSLGALTSKIYASFTCFASSFSVSDADGYKGSHGEEKNGGH